MHTYMTVQAILNAFNPFRMAAIPGDRYEQEGKPLLEDKITRFVNAGEPIRFVMLGYPMKSMNDRDKVLGKLPDLGEKVSLDNFSAFNDSIKNVYSPGVEINIASDGYVFNDLMSMPDTVVGDYAQVVKEYGAGKPINWYSLEDFYPQSPRMASRRNQLDEQFGITEEQLEHLILTDADTRSLYQGMIRFMSEDIRILGFDSRNQLHKAAKRLARRMMLRNEAYSRIVNKEFASYVRLSMHPSINNGKKYSFALIPGRHVKHSPWHSALVVDDNGGYTTMHREDAVAAGYELIYQDNRPYYFRS